MFSEDITDKELGSAGLKYLGETKTLLIIINKYIKCSINAK